MQHKYIATKTLYANGSRSRIGCGVALVEEYDGDIFVLSSIEDLSPDEQAIERLVGLCNTLELDPIQLRDAAEDFLAAL